MYGMQEGEPFKVFARRESVGSGLVIRFECKEGMGVLGIRKSGRSDPAPVAAYEEEEIEPASLRAGRFVHVLPSGQRQSYALSRLSAEVAGRMPTDRWVELKPHTEYGFRYLVAPDSELDSTVAAVAVGLPRAERTGPIPIPAANPSASPAAPDDAPVIESRPEPAPRPAPAPRVSTQPAPERTNPTTGPVPMPPREASTGLPPPQSAMSPVLAEAALKLLTKEQAVDQLRSEMTKVMVLQQRVAELEELVRRSKSRERDLLELLARWSG